MSTIMIKPVNLQPAMEQISIFQNTDNFKSFTFEPVAPDNEKELMLQPFESTNSKSKWNNKHLGNFNLIADNQQNLSTKTIPVELLQGIVNNAKIDGLELWVKESTKKDARLIFNTKIKFNCKNGTLTCLGQF